MSSALELAMRRRVEECLKSVALILESNKASSIHVADQVGHKYEDKYLLSEYLTNMSISSLVNSLPYVGLTTDKMVQLKCWSAQRAVSIRCTTEEKCRFVREIERDEEDPTRVQADGVLGRLAGTVRVITKVKEYIYAVEESYEIQAFSGVGTNASECITLLSRRFNTEITTRSNSPPYKECSRQMFDVNISWLLKQLDASCGVAGYRIDRSKATCFTPRQNDDTRQAISFFGEVAHFFDNVGAWMQKLHDFQVRHSTVPTPSLSDFNADKVFNPKPMFEEGQAASAPASADGVVAVTTGTAAEAPVTLPLPTVNALIAEQKRSLDARCAEVEAMCAGSATLSFTAVEAKVQVIVAHIRQIYSFHQQGQDYIEQMLRSQLVAAIGKEVSAQDFTQYMVFHNRKVFREAFQPRPFSYAVRRSALHSPEGQVQIETAGSGPVEPIYTVAQVTEDGAPMEFALNATSTVKFGGERHLHGWMAHRFSGQALPQLRLVSQARQFSSYIVLIGRIASAKLFQPKYGFIVQNKDEFSIPLELEQIPTAKEFKDAISSLSPEQQRFAKAFRSMQLESTLFAVCVIQIKPQLEKVLKLEADSLTKEIKLTQDLMQLFIKYQIPTDLLSYQEGQEAGGAERAGAAERLLAVKRHVQAMQEMLLSAKEEEVAEKNIFREFTYGASQERDSYACFDAPCAAPPAPRMMMAMSGPGSAGGGGGERYRSISKSSAPPPPPPASSRAPAPAPAAAAPVTTSTSTTSATAKATTTGTPTVRGTREVSESSSNQVDFTKYPNQLEEMYTKYDPDSSLRPTIINPGSSWTKKAQAGLLGKPSSSTLGSEEQNKEKEAAFDLLDALTRSGALPIEHASLHVVIAATHCFDQSVMDTLVQKNVNPIERVERSTLIMAATLQGLPAVALVQESQVERLQMYSPALMLQDAAGDASVV